MQASCKLLAGALIARGEWEQTLTLKVMTVTGGRLHVSLGGKVAAPAFRLLGGLGVLFCGSFAECDVLLLFCSALKSTMRS